LLDTENNFVEP